MHTKGYWNKGKRYKFTGVLLLLLLFACSAGYAQSTVSGTVLDAETGETLPGVNVTVKGTTTGMATDVKGSYSMEVPSLSDTLVFSFVGYQNKEVAIGGRTSIDVELNPQAIMGEEMVVIGYGAQQSEDVTGSISSVQMEDIDSQPVAGIDQSLTGQISGVQVNKTSGIPGGGPEIRIRGLGAIGAGSQPLYVIDGFPIPASTSEVSNPLNDIPPENIESVSVLKDASATAIYGSRGANGVVMITTKSGEAGTTRVQLSAYTGVQAIPGRGRPDVLNAEQFARFQKERIEAQIRYEQNREPTTEEIPEAYRNPEQYGEGTNWFDEITRAAPTRNIFASISGGSEKVRSYFSAGYLGQQGVVLGSDYKRFSMRANLDASLSDNLEVGVNISPTYSLREQVAVGSAGRGDALGNALVASPIPPVYNEDGTFNTMISSPQSFVYPNPVQQLKQIDDDSRTTRLLASAFAQYEIVKNLEFKSTVNIDWNDSRSKRYSPSTVGGLDVYPPVVPSSSLNEFSYLNWLNENTLKYEIDAGPHSFEGLAGLTVQKNNAQSADFSGQDYPLNDEIKTLSAAARILGGSGQEDWSLLSYLTRLNYSYDNTYLLTATLRRDGSSRFGSNSQWGFFPSAALGWRVSNEPFMEDVSWLQDLKVRASYGITGNFEIGNYTYTGQILTNDYILGGSLAPGKMLNSLGNPNLGWERTREINLGIDLSILNGRLRLTTDLYKRNTEDLLLNVEIPASSGFTSVFENRGDVENRGLEIGVNSQNITGPSFSWSTNFNLSINRNEVLELGRSEAPILAGTSGEGNPTNITQIGQPVGMFYGYVSDGLYTSEQEIENSVSYPGAIPGNVKYRDIDGDGNITPVDDYAIIGNPYPDFTWGMTNSLSYKNFNFKVLLTGSYGGSVVKASNEYLLNIDGVFNVSEEVIDRWRSPEDPGDGITPTTAGPSRARVLYRDINSNWVKDNTHLWIKNVTLGYDLPQTLVEGVMRNANVYVSIQNALLFSRYDGNPQVSNYGDVNRYGGVLTPGIDYTNYPVPRIFTIGTKLSF